MNFSMKRIVLFLLAATSISATYAQDITDAVRYGTEELSGTARFTAMSGAFGALGGDLSSLKINPAGSAVFLSSKLAFSLNLLDFTNDVSYNDGFASTLDSDFSLNQLGAVFVFRNTSGNSPFQKFTLGVTYEQTANFDNTIFAMGNNTTTIGKYFLDRAQGVPLDLLIPFENGSLTDLYNYLGTAPLPTGYSYSNYALQQAYLAYEAYTFNAADPNDFENTTYISNIAGNNFYQEYNQVSTGFNGKITFNAGTQFMENLYLGLNINNQFFNYERTTTFYEENNDPASGINEVYFKNTLSTSGSGISFQAGAIYKLGNMFRLGASYTSPTWYTITEETSQYLETYSIIDGRAIADPNVINLFPDYQLRTPGKFTGSFAMVFGKSGLISFDYSYKDFSNTEFDSNLGANSFSIQNTAIENNLTAASTYRVGGEYRIANWSLRGGYRLVESPYQNENIMSDLNGYSLGFGYDFGNTSLDFAYDYAERDYQQRLYQTGLNDRAFIENTNSNYTVTLSFAL